MSTEALKPKISVIIPTKNSGATIEQCLSTLFSQTFRDFEVIIIDGNSADETIKIVSHFPIKKILGEKLGVYKGARAQARNMGVMIADGDVLAFADSDCFFKNNWLETIWREFEEDTGLGILGGSDLVPPEDSALSHATAILESIQKTKVRTGLDACFVIKNCNMACRKDFFRSLGGLNAQALYGEELDFCLKASSSKLHIKFDPSIVVFHHRTRGLIPFVKHSWEAVKLYRSSSTETFAKFELMNPTNRNDLFLVVALFFGLGALFLASFLGLFFEVFAALFAVYLVMNVAYMLIALNRLGFRKGFYLLPLVLSVTIVMRIIAFLVSPLLRRHTLVFKTTNVFNNHPQKDSL